MTAPAAVSANQPKFIRAERRAEVVEQTWAFRQRGAGGPTEGPGAQALGGAGERGPVDGRDGGRRRPLCTDHDARRGDELGDVVGQEEV